MAIKKLHLLYALVAVLLVFFSSGASTIVLAQSAGTEEDANAVYGDRTFYDPTSANSCSVGSTQISNKQVYIVGDSYAVGLRDRLTKQLTDAGYEVLEMNAHTGRGVTTPGNDNYTGLKAIETDKELIAKAGTVLVILGTNPEDYNKTIPLLMKDINTINGTARKFWVNVGVTLPRLQESMTSTNKALEKHALEFKYSVIDWAAKVQATPSLMPKDDFHPTQKGYDVLAALIVSSLGKPAQDATISLPVPKPSKDSGKANEPYVWTYLINKGLTPTQVAGIMGNMKAEAHFEPRLVEYDWLNSRGETSRAGSPTSLDDNVPPNQNDKGQPGYGIVQWTSPNRKQGLRDMVAKTGKKAGDLSLQLDYLWKELTGSYSYVLKDIKQTTTVKDASDAFLVKFERPGDIEGQKPIRAGYGEDFLQKYSGLTGSIAGCADSSGQAGVGGWDLKGPGAMTYYSQVDPRWKETPYGTCKVGDGGCGPTSMAMIISTLSGKKFTPAEIAKEYEALGGAPSCGSGWGYWDKLASNHGLKLVDIGTNLDKAAATLNAGGLVLASFGIEKDVQSLFTGGRHLMVIRKVTADGNSFYLADPLGLDRSSSKDPFTRATLDARNKDGGALNNMWAVTK